MRVIASAILLSLLPLPALGQTAVELRDMASNFGLNPAQARRLYSIFDGQTAQLNYLADQHRLERRAVRNLALYLGAKNQKYVSFWLNRVNKVEI
jgi:hypothetical protein